MGLVVGKSSSVVAHCYYGRGAASASARSTTPFKLLFSSGCGGRPADVLYVDRGVIVLNKPPGLVSQGTSSAKAPVAAKSHHRQETTRTALLTSTSRTAFDDVLDGTVSDSFYYHFAYQGGISQR